MRVVLDTNVWLSGLMLPDSIPGQVVRAVIGNQIGAVLSEPLWDELTRALTYPKVRDRIRLADDALQRVTAELRYVTEWVSITAVKVRVPRDRQDDIVLATFIAGRADALVSCDTDLLELAPRYAVLTARAFVEQHLR